MYNILTLNKIAAIGTSRLGDNYKYGDDVQNPDAVLVRSAAMHDMEFADNLLAIARAGEIHDFDNLHSQKLNFSPPLSVSIML